MSNGRLGEWVSRAHTLSIALGGKISFSMKKNYSKKLPALSLFSYFLEIATLAVAIFVWHQSVKTVVGQNLTDRLPAYLPTHLPTYQHFGQFKARSVLNIGCRSRPRSFQCSQSDKCLKGATYFKEEKTKSNLFGSKQFTLKNSNDSDIRYGNIKDKLLTL